LSGTSLTVRYKTVRLKALRDDIKWHVTDNYSADWNDDDDRDNEANLARNCSTAHMHLCIFTITDTKKKLDFIRQ